MLCLWSGPLGFNSVGFLQYSGVCIVESLSLFHLFFISRFVFTIGDDTSSQGSFMRTKHLFFLIHLDKFV